MIDYEKKYNEAMERARSMYESKDDAELAAFIFPELRESEDERIRKFLIKLVNDGFTHFPDSLSKIDVLDYLEKQKESTWTEEDESFRKHILPRILNPKGWTMEQIEADRKLLKEFVERQKNKWLEKQKEPENVSATTMAPSCWEVEQKEQKPVPKFSVGDYVIDTNYKCEPLYQIVGIDKECYICEYRGDKEMGDRTVMHFTFNNPYLRLEQKPAEWGEEDEEMIKMILGDLEWERRNTTVDKDIRHYDKEIAFLKSLRPSWRPSEEQMNILKAVKDYVGKGSGYWGEGLGSLIEDLEKLM